MKYLAILTASLALLIPSINAQQPSSLPVPAPPIPSKTAEASAFFYDSSATSSEVEVFLIIAISGIAGTVLLWRRYADLESQRKLTHETIRLMVEKGIPIPPEMFADRSSLRLGVINITTSLGFLAFCLISHDEIWRQLWGAGVIGLAIGIGYIVVWKKSNGNPS